MSWYIDLFINTGDFDNSRIFGKYKPRVLRVTDLWFGATCLCVCTHYCNSRLIGNYVEQIQLLSAHFEAYGGISICQMNDGAELSLK